MSTPAIVTGDDVALSVTLKKNGDTFTIDPGADVQSSLLTPDKLTVLVDPFVQSSSAIGADWVNSVVVVEFTSVMTALVYEGLATLEIQVDDGGKTTFFAILSVVKGTI